MVLVKVNSVRLSVGILARRLCESHRRVLQGIALQTIYKSVDLLDHLLAIRVESSRKFLSSNVLSAYMNSKSSSRISVSTA